MVVVASTDVTLMVSVWVMVIVSTSVASMVTTTVCVTLSVAVASIVLVERTVLVVEINSVPVLVTSAVSVATSVVSTVACMMVSLRVVFDLVEVLCQTYHAGLGDDWTSRRHGYSFCCGGNQA